MNKINFAPQQRTKRSVSKRSFSLWPIIICSIVLSITFFLQLQQWVTLHHINQEKQLLEKKLAPFNQISGSQQKLQDELPSLEKTVRIMEHAQPQQDRFLGIYQSIRTLLGAGGSLESLTLTGKKLELTIGLASVKAAQQFIDQLAQVPTMSSLELGSIRKGATHLLFTITGTLT